MDHSGVRPDILVEDFLLGKELNRFPVPVAVYMWLWSVDRGPKDGKSYSAEYTSSNHQNSIGLKYLEYWGPKQAPFWKMKFKLYKVTNFVVMACRIIVQASQHGIQPQVNTFK